ncbi:hypothetical protein NEF87_002618 [Candidatus Lokiarchaeum ossiferum]|uniref:Transcription regulator AsnC/Lrp ligand binding domain-containing protein n=1 Tax=Candidatus Lokiarchaeum ossiferum TaxID=2951803 RepID=A0ABY6HS45_9ARCH|nr:hypothetical protein NEF87_002618 [Candidatus Lokiarchaeum sp. B-35]
MKVKILSFVKVELGRTMEIVEKLQLIKNVKEIYYITGEYDLVMKIEGESSEELQKIMMTQIDIIKGIKKLNSHLMVKRWMTDSEG